MASRLGDRDLPHNGRCSMVSGDISTYDFGGTDRKHAILINLRRVKLFVVAWMCFVGLGELKMFGCNRLSRLERGG